MDCFWRNRRATTARMERTTFRPILLHTEDISLGAQFPDTVERLGTTCQLVDHICLEHQFSEWCDPPRTVVPLACPRLARKLVQQVSYNVSTRTAMSLYDAARTDSIGCCNNENRHNHEEVLEFEQNSKEKTRLVRYPREPP